jgi:heptosyltransferase-2
MRILIVKHGALGDVVRTSYFIEPLRARFGGDLHLTWLTAPAAVPLLKLNPHIDRLATTFEELSRQRYDVVYSLDDEMDTLQGVRGLQAGRIVGACLEGGTVRYSIDSAAWFDMGLRSRFGKAAADHLKKLNRRGHAEIFADIFEVPAALPSFYGDVALEAEWARWVGPSRPAIGINPFASGRWPSKELRLEELRRLVWALLADGGPFEETPALVLIGAGQDRLRNLELARAVADPRLRVADTDRSPLALAALVRNLDLLITSDSLAMHLAICQHIPTIAFFAPTSAAEIDPFGRVLKIASTAADYCSYRRDADNSSITAERLMEAVRNATRLGRRSPLPATLQYAERAYR